MTVWSDIGVESIGSQLCGLVRPEAPVRRRDGDRASRAERAGEPVPVEGHPGQDPLAVRHIRTFLGRINR